MNHSIKFTSKTPRQRRLEFGLALSAILSLTSIYLTFDKAEEANRLIQKQNTLIEKQITFEAQKVLAEEHHKEKLSTISIMSSKPDSTSDLLYLSSKEENKDIKNISLIYVSFAKESMSISRLNFFKTYGSIPMDCSYIKDGIKWLYEQNTPYRSTVENRPDIIGDFPVISAITYTYLGEEVTKYFLSHLTYGIYLDKNMALQGF